jgi:hypothetical protein
MSLTTQPRPDTLPLSDIARRVLAGAARRYAGTSLDLDQLAVEVALGEMVGRRADHTIFTEIRREWGRTGRQQALRAQALPAQWDAADPESDAPFLAVLNAHSGDLWDLVTALPEAERAVVLLRYRDGLTQPETAAALGLTETQARNRDRAGMRRIREQLGIPQRHGTPADYIDGCRCDDCRAANSRACLERKRRARQ